MRPVTEAPLLLSRSSSRPLAGTLRRQDAPDYDQRGRVEEYGGEAAFPAVRSPPPGPVACAHARGAPGAVAVPRGVRGGPRLRGPRGPLPCVGADAGHLAPRGGEVATCRSALPAWHLLGPGHLIVQLGTRPLSVLCNPVAAPTGPPSPPWEPSFSANPFLSQPAHSASLCQKPLWPQLCFSVTSFQPGRLRVYVCTSLLIWSPGIVCRFCESPRSFLLPFQSRHPCRDRSQLGQT